MRQGTLQSVLSECSIGRIFQGLRIQGLRTIMYNCVLYILCIFAIHLIYARYSIHHVSAMGDGHRMHRIYIYSLI